ALRLRGERVRQAVRVDRMDQVEERDRLASLVALEVPDQVPLAPIPSQGRDLGLELLDPILAQPREPRGQRRLQRLRRMRLRDRDDRDLVGTPAPLECARDARLDLIHPFSKCFHVHKLGILRAPSPKINALNPTPPPPTTRGRPREGPASRSRTRDPTPDPSGESGSDSVPRSADKPSCRRSADWKRGEEPPRSAPSVAAPRPSARVDGDAVESRISWRRGT